MGNDATFKCLPPAKAAKPAKEAENFSDFSDFSDFSGSTLIQNRRANNGR
jgi:hypothetical protein